MFGDEAGKDACISVEPNPPAPGTKSALSSAPLGLRTFRGLFLCANGKVAKRRQHVTASHNPQPAFKLKLKLKLEVEVEVEVEVEQVFFARWR